ncbi:hypothetical protein FYK55_06650 [Roseiconus nitratireducens]|uniref:Uncharacterized protein n=1 Tax=Roseiconus nitratireducens TaxID=2605748 RepID=A0A5M6DGJ6_9BACT|nr:hypothetical protein [Roseiconus nitratireducens]KAA5545329.1 hypothetical protein FYK55_06650 [Roseiconus nitratireducens]
MNDPARNPYAAGSSTPGAGGTGRTIATIRSASATGMTITFALVSGVTFITAVMIWMSSGSLQPGESWFRFDRQSVLLLGFGFLVLLGGAGAAFAIRILMTRQAMQQNPPTDQPLPQPLTDDATLPPWAQSLLGSVSASTIVGQALMEGPAIINAILLMIDDNLAHLVPIVLAVIGILLQTPTSSRYQRILEDAARG